MTINYEVDGEVAVVTLAKPPHNLIDDPFILDVAAAYERAVAEGARAILLRSSMRHFCAGAEVQIFDTTTRIQVEREVFDRVMGTLENVPIPTVAALNGGVLGGGLELALTCDMILAADTAFLGQVEVSIGLHPLLGGNQRLVQRAGVARAKEICMLGRRHTPEAFERWGIINLVVPEAELSAASMTWARQLAAGPTKTLAGIKRLSNEAARYGTAAADTLQIGVNEMVFSTADARRGMDAFSKTGPGTAVYEGN